MPASRPLAVRFQEKVDYDRSGVFWSGTRCHEWVAAIWPNGYGQIHHQGKTAYAHRMAWEIANGPIPYGLYVLHRCDNRKCVNIEHLWLGTFDENMSDMAAKGRQAHGSKNGRAKLTEGQVREIRALRGTQAAIAEMYGVSRATVSQIRSGKTWKVCSEDIVCSASKDAAAA